MSHNGKGKGTRKSKGKGDVNANTQEIRPSRGRNGKASDGLVPGGPTPGAYIIRNRAVGEIPVWNNLNDDGEHTNPLALNHARSDEISDSIIYDGESPSDNIYEAELATNQNDIILIEGKNEAICSKRTTILIVGFIVFTSIVAVGVTVSRIASRLTSSATGASHSSMESGNQNQTPVVPLSPNDNVTESSKSSSRMGNLNWTIADMLARETNEGQYIGITHSTTAVIEILNRTDTALTLFAASTQAQFLEGINVSLIVKLVLPIWNGHSLDILESYIVEGQALDLKDMYDGMVLTSLAGHPITVQLDPFRVNNVAITEQNLYYKNGIVHNFLHYPVPIVPWIGKSMFDTLIETNELRMGDLSSFITLINTMPDLKVQLQRLDSSPTTLFVPMNSAMAMLDLNLIEQGGQEGTNSSFRQLVLNHIVNGNFARSFWLSIPTGIVINDTALELESSAGHLLTLSINENVIINGEATIIQEDIFSEGGIVHVIDKLLLSLI